MHSQKNIKKHCNVETFILTSIYSLYDMWVADGAHQTTNWTRSTLKHLPHDGNAAFTTA